MSRRYWPLVLLVASALGAVVAIPLAVNYITLDSADKIASIAGAVAGVSALVVSIYVFRSSYQSVDSDGTNKDKDLAAISLIRIMAAIEYSSLAIFEQSQERDGATPRHLSLRQIQERLIELKVWSENDVVGFGKVIQVRNRVVHGDLQSISTAELLEATRKAKTLLNRLPGPPVGD